MSVLVTQVSKVVEAHFRDQTAFLKKLVAIKSANPFTPEFSDPRVPVELEAAKLIRETLKSFKVRTRLVGSSKERPNVVGWLGRSRARKSLILNGHMDTVVPPDSYRGDPYDPFIRGERMYGLGVLDMKAVLSAYVFLPRILSDLKVNLLGKLILQFVVDEEPGACSKLGTKYLLRQGIRAKAAIVGEPGNQIGIGHRGGYRFKLTTKGEAVHTGVSAWQEKVKGRSAIEDMMRVIKALRHCDLPFKTAKAFPRKKPVFTFPTLINGGTAINIVPDTCIAYGDVRLMPGNSDKQVRLCIEERLKKEKDLKYSLEDLLFVPAVEIDEKEEVVVSLAEAFRAVGKKKPVIEGIGPWNDGWMFIKKDIPAIVQVPLEGGGAHGSLEWVSLKGLRQLTTALTLAVLTYLGTREG